MNMAKWNKKSVSRLYELLESGKTPKEISKELNRSPQEISTKIKTTNWADVADGGDGTAQSKPWSEEEKVCLFESKNAGSSYTEIGKILRRTGNACEKFYNSYDWSDFFVNSEQASKNLGDNIANVVDEMIDDRVTKASDDYKKKVIKELSGRLSDREMVVRRLEKIVPTYPVPEKLSLASTAKKNFNDPEECVLVLSDLQVGQLVESRHTTGIGSFNKELLVSRMDNLKRTVEHIVSSKLSNHNLTKLHVLLLGDIVEGKDIYEGQVYRTDMNVGEQIMLAYSQISECLIYLSSLFSDIEVSCIRGNHGRISKNCAPEENYDTIVYNMCELACKNYVREGKMKFLISDNMMEIVDINTWKFLIMHGDGLPGGSNGLPYAGADRIENSIYKMTKGGFQYMVFGHFHRAGNIESSSGGEIICNGTWVGGSDLSINRMALTSRPRQAFFGVHQEYGKTWEYPIYLNKGEEGWNKH
jgi:hypothetical protein